MGAPFNPFQPGTPASATGGSFGPGTPGPAAPLVVAQPPTALLAAAGVAALAGLITAGIGWQAWYSLIGWALAGPIAIGLLGAFIGVDTRRRAEPVYVRPDWMGAAYAAVVAVAVIGIIVGSVSFALWMGRR